MNESRWRYTFSLTVYPFEIVGAMKLFQLIEKALGILGIFPPKQPEENPITWRRLTTLFILVQFSISSIVFFLFEAATFREYADSFYISATAMLKVCTYIVALYKSKKMFGLIQKLEFVIHTRELQFFPLKNWFSNYDDIFSRLWESNFTGSLWCHEPKNRKKNQNYVVFIHKTITSRYYAT